jgi:hypothetical protein
VRRGQLDLERDNRRGIALRIRPADDREHAFEVLAVLVANSTLQGIVTQVALAFEEQAALRDVNDDRQGYEDRTQAPGNGPDVVGLTAARCDRRARVEPMASMASDQVRGRMPRASIAASFIMLA